MSEYLLVNEEMALDTEIVLTSERIRIREFPCYDCISTACSQISICNNTNNDQYFWKAKFYDLHQRTDV